MKARHNFIILLFATFVFTFSSAQARELRLSLDEQSNEIYGDLLQCPMIDISNGQNQGKTFLNFIMHTVKPQLDLIDQEGHTLADGDTLVAALDSVDRKVRNGVLKGLKGRNTNEKKKNLKKIGELLSGKRANHRTLPELIAGTRLARDRYTLSTYIGLASCGGVNLKLAGDNYSYNVHYGSGIDKNDQKSGRSFGASRVVHATDSSYSYYLKELEKYVTNSPENTADFVSTIMETLTNLETRNYEKVTDQGDAILTDFFSIWVAEQTRNLMDHKITPHWDAALLQVTLLSIFHSGQKEVKLFYRDPLSDQLYFTTTTYKLAWPKKDRATESCIVDLDTRKKTTANLTHYIGVHYRTFEHCGRSGINMSRREWKKLSKEITGYLMSHEEGQQLVENVRQQMKDVIKPSKTRFQKSRFYNQDILREIAKFIINEKTVDSIDNWEGFSKDVTTLMEYIRLHAQTITDEISRKYQNTGVVELE